MLSKSEVERCVMLRCFECERRKEMIFHLAHKLNTVLGLNDQELEWLEELGAKVEREAT